MNIFKALTILLAIILTSSCGVPRAEYDKVRDTLIKEKKELQSRNSKLEQELSILKARLAEKETQYSSLFFRYETLSKEFLKLKRSLNSPDLSSPELGL